MKTSTATLSTTERTVRMGASLGMIGVVLAGTGPLGAMALLPLFAIYPGITAAVGEDPLVAGVRRLNQGRRASYAHAPSAGYA